jgi:hypothetical protein
MGIELLALYERVVSDIAEVLAGVLADKVIA